MKFGSVRITLCELIDINLALSSDKEVVVNLVAFKIIREIDDVDKCLGKLQACDR